MLVDKKTRRQARIQNYLFLFLCIGIIASLAWLSTRYSFEADWTASGRNSLSAASIALLKEMPDDIVITSYATEDQNLRRSIDALITRYQRHKSNLHLRFVNPDLVPDTIRQLGISSNGELIVEYQGRQQNLNNVSEQAITNTLQQLARSGDRWLVFLTGHGERNPQGAANHDFDSWAQQLTAKGFKTRSQNLATHPQLAHNTSVLVIASPQLELLTGEISLLQEYLERGGNLLWFSDPDAPFGLSLLEESLGIQAQAGVIVDPGSQLLGISDPRFALVGDYPQHEITRNFDTITLFPQALGLISQPLEDWHNQTILLSNERSWSETGQFSERIQFDQDADISGPLNLGIALQRNLKKEQNPHQQRVVVLGDGDFLANAYLGNGGNLQLGLNIINWLAYDERFIDIPVKISADKNLQLTPLLQGIIGFGFLLILPLILAASGFFIWRQRRKR